MIVYDNINMSFRRYNQRTTNKDSFENGATATLILTFEKPPVEQVQDPTRHLRASDIYPTAAQDVHLKGTYRYHLIEVLRRRTANSFQNPISEPVKNRLKVERTKAYPLPSMHIDQSTVEGNRDILDEIMKVLELSPETCFDDQTRLIVAGDQLTLARVRSIARLRWDEDKAYYRVEWAVPVLQLFHLQMVLATTILKTHWGSRKTPGSLCYFITVLEESGLAMTSPISTISMNFFGMFLTPWSCSFGRPSLRQNCLSRPPNSHPTRQWVSKTRLTTSSTNT